MNDVEVKSRNLFVNAAALGASDIHFHPRAKDTLVRLRLNAKLINVERVPNRFYEKWISHLKFLAGMDIGEKRKPQNASLDVRILDNFVNLRLSTLPTPYHESLVIRLLPQQQTLSLHELALFPRSYDKLISLLFPLEGLVLLTGPTGSGKTTLLYALLSELEQKYAPKVITIEDPVEVKNDNYIQMEVNEKAGLTYAEGLKAILRHDPDVIMIGEIRHEETAKIAVRAAMTGHLVLTTMHTTDSWGAVYRLLEFGIPLSFLQQSLNAVVAQRLVSLLCPFCGPNCHPSCFSRRKRTRLGVYEILSGHPLKQWVSSLTNGDQSPARPKITSLRDEIKKGVAYGFLAEQVLSETKTVDVSWQG
ncbi:MAG TPA: competence type IV pilus ATPase ComGA [Bacillales bacterium]|nr:competence type IV pilus ATPase ComGA [Bacillales bacterium]